MNRLLLQDSKNIYRKLSVLVIISYFVYAVLYVFFGEKIPVNNGFGWDGDVYGNAVRNFVDQVKNHSISSYHLQRLFPSGVISLVLNLTGVELTNENIILAFEFYNIGLILLSAILWLMIAKKLNFSDQQTFLGILCIVITFPVLKFSLYYPVLTDCTALCLGFLTLYGFISRKNQLLFISILIACFTWPVAAFTIPLLLIFKREKKFEAGIKQKVNWLLFAIGLLALDAYIFYFYIIEQNISSNYPAYVLMAPAKGEYLNLIIGTLCFNIFLLGCFWFILKFNITANLKVLKSSVNYKWLIITVIILLGVKYYSLGFPPRSDVKFSWYLIGLFTTPPLQPFVNLICMILFFGPVIYLGVFNWNRITEHANQYGTGFMIFFLANLFLCLDAETRHVVFFYPFLLLLIISVLKKQALSGLFIVVFAFIALVYSKVWFTINTDEFVHSILYDKEFSKEVHQRYFMHSGIFMNYKYYLIQAPVVIITGFILYFLFAKKNKEIR